jgi:hypothetical protein
MRMTRRRRGQSLREGKPGTDTLRASWTPEGSPTTRTSSLADDRPLLLNWSAQTLGRWPGLQGRTYEVASEGPHIVGPCHQHLLEIARALGRRVVASASLPTGMLCRGAASSIRSGRSDCNSGREAAEFPRATDCPRVERPGTSGAPSLPDSRCCKPPAKPGGSTGGTSGSADAWLSVPALTATVGTDQTCVSATPGHVLTRSTAARERLAAWSRFRWASVRSRRCCLVTVPHGYRYNPRSGLHDGRDTLSRSLGPG